MQLTDTQPPPEVPQGPGRESHHRGRRVADRPAAAVFNAAFAALAAKFDYPNILRKPTQEILHRFRAGGSGLVLLWWSFAMLAALLTPATYTVWSLWLVTVRVYLLL